MDLTELKVTYEELFELLEISKTNYNETQYSKSNIYVNSPSGFKKINAGVVKPNCDMINIKFDNNTECNVAKTHIFSVNGNEVFAKDITQIDTKFGTISVLSKTEIGIHDGFDINIDYPHWYYNDTGMIYHNSLLMTDLVTGNLKEFEHKEEVIGKNGKPELKKTGVINPAQNVLLVSMEMEDKEIMKRVHANALGLPINKLSAISPDTIRIAHEKLYKENKIGKFFIKDYPSGTFSPLMLDALLDNYKTELGVEFDIVYLDYLGIMKSDLITPNAGLYSYIKSIVEETRSIAKKRKIPIVSASQLNRCLEENTNIHMSNGLVPIKDVNIGDKTENNLKVVKKKFTGVQKVHKIKTKSGKEIITSANHKFPTNIGIANINVGLKVGIKLCTNV